MSRQFGPTTKSASCWVTSVAVMVVLSDAVHHVTQMLLRPGQRLVLGGQRVHQRGQLRLQRRIGRLNGRAVDLHLVPMLFEEVAELDDRVERLRQVRCHAVKRLRGERYVALVSLVEYRLQIVRLL